MKPRRRTRTWAFVSIALVFILGSGLVILATCREWAKTTRGESFPQFTGPPGLRLRGAHLWGMPNRDLYTPVDSPPYVPAEAAQEFLKDDDRVYLIRKPGVTYVFPEVLLTSYHVVNDVIDGEPLAVTFCLLAGSACRFSREVEGKVLTLGLTGQLYCGNSVLYDNETETDWLQMNGEPLRGHYFGRARLEARPLECMSWKRARREEDLKVLAPLRAMEEYRKFYREMDSEKLGKKVVESQIRLDNRLLPYTRGLAILVQGEPRFYPDDPNAPRRLRNDRVGGWDIVVLGAGEEESRRIFRRHLAGRTLDFDLMDDGIADRQTGSRWSEDGVCLHGKLEGARLESPFFTQVYWFVWSTLYPETELP